MKAVALVSGGIDSPVAAYLVSRKMEIVPLHFCLHPFYCEVSFELVMESLKALRAKIPFEKVVLYPWGEILSTALSSHARKYMCVICKRGMFKGAELVCKFENANVIVTGESLGQKASQRRLCLDHRCRGSRSGRESRAVSRLPLRIRAFSQPRSKTPPEGRRQTALPC